MLRSFGTLTLLLSGNAWTRCLPLAYELFFRYEQYELQAFPPSYLSVSFCHFDLAFAYILAYLTVSVVALTLVDIDFCWNHGKLVPGHGKNTYDTLPEMKCKLVKSRESSAWYFLTLV